MGVGEQVDGTPAQPLLEVANVDRVEVAAHVAADHLGRVRVGQPAAIVSDAYPDRTFDGEVIAIAPAIDPATNAALVRIRVKNPERLLKVGMFAQARIGLAGEEGGPRGAALGGQQDRRRERPSTWCRARRPRGRR